MNSRTCLYQDLRLFFDSQTSAAVQLLSLKWNVTSNKRFHVCFCLRLNKNLFTDTSGLVCSDHVGVFYTCCEVAKARRWNQSGVWQLLPKEGIQDRKCQRKPELQEPKLEKEGHVIAQHHDPLFWDPSGWIDLVCPEKLNSRGPCLWSGLPGLLWEQSFPPFFLWKLHVCSRFPIGEACGFRSTAGGPLMTRSGFLETRFSSSGVHCCTDRPGQLFPKSSRSF